MPDQQLLIAGVQVENYGRYANNSVLLTADLCRSTVCQENCEIKIHVRWRIFFIRFEFSLKSLQSYVGAYPAQVDKMRMKVDNSVKKVKNTLFLTSKLSAH